MRGPRQLLRCGLGSKVGAIRDANQGCFPSLQRTQAFAINADEGARRSVDASIMKKVPVVSTIDYYLLN